MAPYVVPCKHVAMPPGDRRSPVDPDGRHSPEWYDQSDEMLALAPGDRLFVPCEGGPCTSRLERFPPRLELDELGGTYVLLDVGPRADWKYLFVPHDE